MSAQSIHEPISSLSDINVEFLENTIKEQIDSLRQLHELNALANDILHKAAVDQANFLKRSGSLFQVRQPRKS